jgi:nitroimidazol reductase NimA-like FMN-containing flavoprotein (pyridoxamine 5'-phosphate oxidase superfamily)
MDLTQAALEAKRLGQVAFVATTRPDGRPHAVPVLVAWHEDVVYALVSTDSVKVRNVRNNPKAIVHWQVSQDTNLDSLIVEGNADVIDTTEGRRSLWDKMGYECNAFEPGGPEADTHVFIRLTPERITFLKMYGTQGREVWNRS